MCSARSSPGGSSRPRSTRTISSPRSWISRPLTRGRLLVVPREHAPDLEDLDEGLGARCPPLWPIGWHQACADPGSPPRASTCSWLTASRLARRCFTSILRVIPRNPGDGFRLKAKWRTPGRDEQTPPGPGPAGHHGDPGLTSPAARASAPIPAACGLMPSMLGSFRSDPAKQDRRPTTEPVPRRRAAGRPVQLRGGQPAGSRWTKLRARTAGGWRPSPGGLVTAMEPVMR